jgi:hypothetical protein
MLERYRRARGRLMDNAAIDRTLERLLVEEQESRNTKSARACAMPG